MFNQILRYYKSFIYKSPYGLNKKGNLSCLCSTDLIRVIDSLGMYEHKWHPHYCLYSPTLLPSLYLIHLILFSFCLPHPECRVLK